MQSYAIMKNIMNTHRAESRQRWCCVGEADRLARVLEANFIDRTNTRRYAQRDAAAAYRVDRHARCDAATRGGPLAQLRCARCWTALFFFFFFFFFFLDGFIAVFYFSMVRLFEKAQFATFRRDERSSAEVPERRSGS